MSRSAKEFLEECEYVRQEDDTVFIDEQALVDMMEAYAIYYHDRRVE